MESKNENSPDIGSLRIDPEYRDSNGRSSGHFWIIFLVLIIAVACVYGWWRLKNKLPEVPVTQVRVIDNSRKDSAVLTASGYVEARRQATVSSKITGQVTELLVEEGMMVEAGQVLARLDDAEARAQLDSAQAQVEVTRASIPELEIRLAEAKRSFERISALFERKMVSEEQYDQARTQRDSLNAQLTLARQQLTLAEAGVEVILRRLENYTIRAPFSGIAISKDAQIGEMISPISAGGGYTRTGISTLVDMSSLEVEVDVNESYIARVQPDQRVVAVLDAYPDWEIPAFVRTVIPSADRQKATVKVRISFDQLDPRILPDMGVKVSFLTEIVKSSDEESKSIIIVDSGTIFNRSSNAYVLVCQSNDVLEYRPVKIGRVYQKGLEITEGLTQGEWVVADASLSLNAGQTVKPIR